ncbi:heme lyase CcmF/NrfE family subunit [Ketogulonicigenium vulgare]|uniref:heme lyase CcmF/NrfE family subunit n=1 Tax=Ketogulonicigenium vulgare TaxID=92945 RepID=UPI002359B97A|nr:heme lyase CcmF/NrfE family subunit [Ketogulonicigenium vulgare]
MTVELGHFALILAFAVAILQMIVPMYGAQKGWRGWMAFGAPAATAQAALVAFSFGALTWAFVTSDFSLKLAVVNSHTDKPLIYKISGVWGNHEGSMLLWLFILAIFGAAVAWFGGDLPERLRARVLAVQASISVAFYAFTLFTSNPFERMVIAPLNGQDLNPLLQDPGLAYHPPFLYLGYVGFSVAFSFAIAALIEGKVDAAWGRWVRPWTLAAWSFLTVGIALGSWWAYYELGWGGFWFWDPVENASFMPWLIGAALLHSAIVVEKREALKSWTVLLAILAFGFSLLGTFIVRSGTLTSVHAFASDPARGSVMLAIMGFYLGGGLTLYAARASAMEAKGVFSLVSRESALVMNNVLLAVAAFVVLIGTIWPLVTEVIGRTVSVGPPFFNAAFTPFMIALSIILPLGSVLAWKRGTLGKALQQMWGAAVLAFALMALAWVMTGGSTILAPIGVLLGTWVVAASAVDVWARTGRGDIRGRLSRLTRLPRADWGKAVSHIGFGATILGVALSLSLVKEDIRVMNIGDTFELGNYTFNLTAVNELQGPNYLTTMADVTISRDGQEVASLHPEKRFYPFAGMPTTEAGISSNLLRDVYVVLGDPQVGGGYAMRSYIKPFVNWIWIGAGLMAIGGGISLSDRRLRVAAGAAKKAQRAAGVPAE